MADKPSNILSDPSIGNLTLADLVGLDLILEARANKELEANIESAAPRERGYRYANVNEDIVIETDLIAQDVEGPVASDR